MALEFAEPMQIDAAEGALLARTIKAGSKSFDMASRLLPARYRLPARALYAFCRSSDDAVDENPGSSRPTLALKARLAAIYAGNPGPRIEDRAFAMVAHHHRIPFAVPAALLEGFEWDEQGRRYETLDDLLDYAARVAGTVGVMMCLVMERHERETLSRAAELGLAMQLTNIARDVGEDARRGRVYLPLEWMHDAGWDADTFLADPRHGPALAGVVRRLLAEADRHYRLATGGIAGLPFGCRAAIASAASIYRAIGTRVAANGYDSISQRAVTGSREKLLLASGAALSVLVPGRVPEEPAHRSVRFLVDAAHRSYRSREIVGPVGRMVQILATLEERERRLTSVSRMRAGR